jgi:hypothetical protein
MAVEVGYWEESTGRRGSQGERGKEASSWRSTASSGGSLGVLGGKQEVAGIEVSWSSTHLLPVTHEEDKNICTKPPSFAGFPGKEQNSTPFVRFDALNLVKNI